MSDGWLIIIVLAVLTAAVRAAGPVLLGGRDLPPRLVGTIALLAPALLAALIATDTFADGDGRLVIDHRAVGVAGAGAVLLVRRQALLPAVAVAVVLAASARALFGV